MTAHSGASQATGLRVYVAHHRDDRAVAEVLWRTLIDWDHRPFLENAPPGAPDDPYCTWGLRREEWDGDVEEKLYESDAMVFVWSGAARADRNSGLHTEIQLAKKVASRRHPVPPFMVAVHRGSVGRHDLIPETYFFKYPLSDQHASALRLWLDSIGNALSPPGAPPESPIPRTAAPSPTTLTSPAHTPLPTARVPDGPAVPPAPKSVVLSGILGTNWLPSYPITTFCDFKSYQRIAASIAQMGTYLIAWTMHGSPLRVASLDQNLLSREDRDFAAFPLPDGGGGKYRVVVFPDGAEVTRYIAARWPERAPELGVTTTDRDIRRLRAFEESVTTSGGTLLFTTSEHFRAYLRTVADISQDVVADLDMGIALLAERSGVLFESGFKTDRGSRSRPWHVTISIIDDHEPARIRVLEKAPYEALYGDLYAKKRLAVDYFLSGSIPAEVICQPESLEILLSPAPRGPAT